MAGQCLFAVQRSPASRDDEARARVDALAAFYEPLGADPGQSDVLASTPHVLAGAIRFGATPAAGPGAVSWWLERPPRALAVADGLLRARDADLRAVRTGLLVATDGERCRLVTGACGPVSLYAAQGPAGRAWSTHMVAAAVLAGLDPEVDATALPDLLALGFVAGERALLAGVRPVAPATRVDCGPDGVEVATTWSAGDRWVAPPAPEAASAAREALLVSLDERLHREAAPRLGITAGLDSLVVAAAARELGRSLPCFTWAHDPADAAGGAAAAGRLGHPHEVLAPAWHDEGAGLDHIATQVRATEGLGRMNAFGDLPWPEGMSALVTGGGGEVGRAFWWRAQGRSFREPRVEQVARVFRPERELSSAPDAVRAGVRDRVREGLERLAAHGVRGWALLDALYGEWRLTRWGRGMLGTHDGATLAAFADARVLAAMAAMPAADRLADGFHRHVLDATGHPVPPAAGAGGQRRGIPRPVRRAAAAARGRRRAGDAPWPWAEAVRAMPAYAAWLEGVLAHPLVEDALGRPWARHAAAAFPDGTRAGEAALVLSGPVALDEALRDLRGALARTARRGAPVGGGRDG